MAASRHSMGSVPGSARRILLLMAASLLAAPQTVLSAGGDSSPGFPMAINTWGGAFTDATDAAYNALLDPSKSALDAVEIGCTRCEDNQCDGSVGYGGSPDENCETTLDAMIMDGVTMKSGSVAALRRVKNAIGVARAVLEHVSHTLLVGDFATQFALENGFAEEDTLSTNASTARCHEWRASGCPGNYRQNVRPDPASSCGPYEPVPLDSTDPSYFGKIAPDSSQTGHDTISMATIDAAGIMAAGSSTNGASFKVPGRVGDAPITGSGSYVDGDVGACGATGDGDVMMRFLPCYQAVESLRRGMTPTEAATDAVVRMLKKYPSISSGIVVVDRDGRHGAAASGWGDMFTYAFRGGNMTETEVVQIADVDPSRDQTIQTQP